MDTRTFLNSIKEEMNLKTDEELSQYIGASKSSLDKWIQRNRVPDKWKFIIKEKLEVGPSYIKNVRVLDYQDQNNTLIGRIHVDLSQFDHKEDIQEIIRLLPYASGEFLNKVKRKLRSFKELSNL